MKSISIIYLLMFILFCKVMTTRAQTLELPDSLSSTEIIDSLFIDRDLANYSIRGFANFKNQSFRFTNGINDTKFYPNNRFGVGFGFASKKLVIDIAFNIKLREENPTDRFDLRISFKHKSHFVDYFFQRYKGFNIESPELSVNTFRSDVISVTNGLNYLYLINDKNYQVGAIRSVISHRSKTSFSFGFGGFGLVLNHKGDTALLSFTFNNSNESNGVNRIVGIGGGLLSGIGGFFSMGYNLYSSVAFKGGIGLMYKELSGDLNQDITSSPMLYHLYLTAVIGYVRDRYYLNLSAGLGFYGTEISNNTRELLNVSQAKIAFGYRFLK